MLPFLRMTEQTWAKVVGVGVGVLRERGRERERDIYRERTGRERE